MYEAAGKARDGDLAYFKSLSALELGSLLVGRDEDGRTLLHTAAAEGHLELLQLLIAAGSGKVANKHDDEVSCEAYCPHLGWSIVISCTPWLWVCLACTLCAHNACDLQLLVIS